MMLVQRLVALLLLASTPLTLSLETSSSSLQNPFGNDLSVDVMAPSAWWWWSKPNHLVKRFSAPPPQNATGFDFNSTEQTTPRNSVENDVSTTTFTLIEKTTTTTTSTPTPVVANNVMKGRADSENSAKITINSGNNIFPQPRAFSNARVIISDRNENPAKISADNIFPQPRGFNNGENNNNARVIISTAWPRVQSVQQVSPPTPILMEPSEASDSNAFIAQYKTAQPSPTTVENYADYRTIQQQVAADAQQQQQQQVVVVSPYLTSTTSTTLTNIGCDIRYGQYAHLDCRRKIGSNAAFCSSFASRCECRQSYVFDGSSCVFAAKNTDVRIIGDRCSSTADCQSALHNSYCNTTFNTCQCRAGFVPGVTLDKCVAYADRVGSRCETNQQCEAIVNSYCAAAATAGITVNDDGTTSLPQQSAAYGECQCLTGFVPLNFNGVSTCVPRAQAVGDPCLVDRQCEALWIANLSCISGFCICPPTTMVYLPNNNMCASRSGLGQSCMDSAQCDANVIGAVCSSDKRICECRADHDNYANQFCIKRTRPRHLLPGQSCTYSSECAASNSTCTEGFCQCPYGYILPTTDTAACRPVAPLDEVCTLTEQCSTLVSNSECRHERCACQGGYSRIHRCTGCS